MRLRAPLPLRVGCVIPSPTERLACSLGRRSPCCRLSLCRTACISWWRASFLSRTCTPLPARGDGPSLAAARPLGRIAHAYVLHGFFARVGRIFLMVSGWVPTSGAVWSFPFALALEPAVSLLRGLYPLAFGGASDCVDQGRSWLRARSLVAQVRKSCCVAFSLWVCAREVWYRS